MEINEIKARLSIQTVLSHYGLKPNKNNMLNCPFHDDGTASLKIYPRTNTFNCFGCGKNGDHIQFIELYEDYARYKAILKVQGLKPQKKIRILTIQSDIRYNPNYFKTEIPLLHLKGLWLKQAGFIPGKKVQVEVSPNQLTIKPTVPWK